MQSIDKYDVFFILFIGLFYPYWVIPSRMDTNKWEWFRNMIDLVTFLLAMATSYSTNQIVLADGWL